MRSQARPRHAAASLRPRAAPGQDRARPRHRPARLEPPQLRATEHPDGELAARDVVRPRGVRRPGAEGVGVSAAHANTGRGMGFAISSYLSGAGTAIYWNDMPH